MPDDSSKSVSLFFSKTLDGEKAICMLKRNVFELDKKEKLVTLSNIQDKHLMKNKLCMKWFLLRRVKLALVWSHHHYKKFSIWKASQVTKSLLTHVGQCSTLYPLKT